MSVVENLCKEFSKFSLHIPHWTIEDQKLTALWGPSGSGKTTVVRSLSGLEERVPFRWTWGGVDLAALPAYQRGVGVVLQHYGLFPHLSAEANIYFPVEAQGLNRQELQSDFKKWVDLLKLGDLLKSKAQILSGGEQQRVALARALITRPKYLILDEPFSALDIELKQSARELLKSVLQEGQIGALLVTHDKEDIAALAQQVVILQKGRIIATQTPEDFLKRV